MSVLAISAQYNISGGIGSPYLDETNSTNNEKIYILNTLSNATISYSTNQSIVRFYKYSNSITEKELIPASDISSISSSNTTTYTIRNLEDSKGYFAEVDGKTTSVIWIIDYSLHLPQLNSIQFVESDYKCTELKLLIDKTDDLYFFSANGTRHRLIRTYDIEYKNLVWSDTDQNFNSEVTKIENLDIGTEYTVDAPLTDTSFKISGDQFAKNFNINIAMESPLYIAVAVEAHIISEQLTENQDDNTSELGAPVEFQFYGKGNEPTAYYYTWLIYKTTDMDNPIVRYTDQDIKFTFKESGEYSVKMEVTDKSAQCTHSDSIQIQTSSSLLNVPNFLVLDGEHKFRVTYKSISNFRCTIFNRWGNKIYEFTDPSQGWDGKYNGRYVTPGVYFYVIRAKGADGKDRNKAGDINVLRRK